MNSAGWDVILQLLFFLLQSVVTAHSWSSYYRDNTVEELVEYLKFCLLSWPPYIIRLTLCGSPTC